LPGDPCGCMCAPARPVCVAALPLLLPEYTHDPFSPSHPAQVVQAPACGT